MDGTDNQSPMQWSNHGVLLLEMGRLEDGILLFKYALKVLGVDQDHGVWNVTLPQKDRNTPLPSRVINGWSVPLRDSFVDGIYVYSRAVYLHPVFHPAMVNVYAAAILVNLGLAQHLLAIKHMSTDNFRITERCYNYAMHFVEEDLLSETDFDKDLLRTILFNNSGHIFHTTYLDSATAAECFAVVFRRLMQTDEDRKDASSMDDVDIAGLLSNTLVSICSTAPAA
jgi:hypothetical protein